MNPSIALSSMFSGLIPRALANRASRDRPTCARFSESVFMNSVQTEFNGAFDFCSIGLRPLA